MRKLYIFLLIALVGTACSTNNNLEETITSDQALTVIAQTVDAELATVSLPTGTHTQSPSPEPSSTTTLTPTAILTTAVLISETPASLNPPGSTACDDSIFLSDVTIPDGTELSPGDTFTKTWRIQNNGTCTWNSDYAVIFVDGSILGATSPITLTVEAVPSGGVVDISVGMVAPETKGSYKGYWRMQNPSDLPFGVIFYVEILVNGAGGTQLSTSDGSTTPTVTIITPTPTRKWIGPRSTPTP